MTFLVELKDEEHKLVRKIAKLQLAGLHNILNNEVEDMDITLHCINAGLDRDELIEAVNNNIVEWRKLLHTPEYIGGIDEDNLTIFKTILFKFFDEEHNTEPRKALFRKLMFTSFYKVGGN